MESYEDCIIFLLAKAYQRAHAIHKEQLRPYGLTAVQHLILGALCMEDGQRAGKIGHKLVLDNATLSGTMDRMAENGWISKETDTADGVELRILRHLFTPEQAELAVHLTLKLEKAEATSQRAGLPVEEVAPRLNEMVRNGLVFSIESPGRPPVYMPHLSQAAFGVLSQLRTVPVGKSLSAASEVLAYESVEQLIRGQEKILVAPCICRCKHQMKGGGKLEEACLVFGWGVEYYQRNGLGRSISQDEALAIPAKAEEEGLVA